MKEKLFDLVLVMLLILVAFAVGLTLFGPSFQLSDLGRGFGASHSNNKTSQHLATTEQQAMPNANKPTEANNGTEVVSVIVPTVDLPANPNSQNTSQTNSSRNNSNADNVSNAEASTSTTNTSTANTPTAPAEPLPDGAIDLQSIGFSYVTGGAGACGVTLKAWRHVAVSRDILAKYPCGSKITINIDKPIAGHSSFKAIVGDTMNKKHTKTVNIYVGKDEPALEYGRQKGSLVP